MSASGSGTPSSRLRHRHAASSSAAAYTSSPSSDEESEAPTPRRPQTGVVEVELNGKRRSSIIEYVQRENDTAPAQLLAAGARSAHDRSGGVDGDDASDDDESTETTADRKQEDPFYRELEKAEAERQRQRERQQEEREEEERQVEDEAETGERERQQVEDRERAREARLALVSSPSPAASSTPSRSSMRGSVSNASTPAQGARRTTWSRLPTRGSVSGNAKSASRKSVTGNADETALVASGALPAVILSRASGRRRFDRQLAMVRRSMEEVEATMQRKLRMEKEKDRQRDRDTERDRDSSSAAEHQPAIPERAEEESPSHSASPSSSSLPPIATARLQEEEKTDGKELAVLLRVETKQEEKEPSPFAAILSNLSFSHTLLPLTAEELAMTSLSASAPPSPSSAPLLLPAASSSPSSPRPLQYESCFPSWLSSRSDFTSFIGQTQLLCLHLASKPADKRSAKDVASLSAFLQSFTFFSRFSSHTLSEMARTLWLERRKQGDRVDSKMSSKEETAAAAGGGAAEGRATTSAAGASEKKDGAGGSVMRFIYSGRVEYETSIARLFKKQRREQQAGDSKRREREKERKDRDRNGKAAGRDRAAPASAAEATRAADKLRAAARQSKRASKSSVSVAFTGTAERTRSATLIVSTPAAASASARPTSVPASIPDPMASARTRANTTPPVIAQPGRSFSLHGQSPSLAANDQILSNALSFDPADIGLLSPSAVRSSPTAASASAASLLSESSSRFDELLLTHSLGPGGTFGQSLLFEHFFSSFSFSQVYALKQQQRLHALLGRGMQQRGWGTVRQLVRSLMEQKSSLHIHSVDCVSEDTVFLCWSHADLEAIAGDGRRHDVNEMVAALRVLPFFASWPFSSIQDTAARADVRIMRRGEMLVREGESCHTVWLVVKGRCDVWKHCSVERAERWPAGSRQWEVTRTQRVRRYKVGEMAEGEVVGVEGVCGVAVRDFDVSVQSESVLCYVIKRVAFASWSGMKKVVRECQSRMLHWRETAMRELELQAEGKEEYSKWKRREKQRLQQLDQKKEEEAARLTAQALLPAPAVSSAAPSVEEKE